MRATCIASVYEPRDSLEELSILLPFCSQWFKALKSFPTLAERLSSYASSGLKSVMVLGKKLASADIDETIATKCIDIAIVAGTC